MEMEPPSHPEYQAARRRGPVARGIEARQTGIAIAADRPGRHRGRRPLNLLPASHLVSTHIRGFGHALFHVRENNLEFRRRSGR